MRIKHNKLIFEYDQITPYIYIGTNKCCEIHFKSALLKKGIKGDISLEQEKVDSPIGVDYFLWLPTKDHKAPKLKQMKLGIEAINWCIKNKIKIYVHCERGHSRSATLVAAYFISKGLTTKQAIEKIKKKRKTIHPNSSQIKALEIFEKKIKKNVKKRVH